MYRDGATGRQKFEMERKIQIFFWAAVKALGKRKEKQASAAGRAGSGVRGAALCSEVRAVLIPKWTLEQTSERGK